MDKKEWMKKFLTPQRTQKKNFFTWNRRCNKKSFLFCYAGISENIKLLFNE